MILSVWLAVALISMMISAVMSASAWKCWRVIFIDIFYRSERVSSSIKWEIRPIYAKLAGIRTPAWLSRACIPIWAGCRSGYKWRRWGHREAYAARSSKYPARILVEKILWSKRRRNAYPPEWRGSLWGISSEYFTGSEGFRQAFSWIFFSTQDTKRDSSKFGFDAWHKRRNSLVISDFCHSNDSGVGAQSWTMFFIIVAHESARAWKCWRVIFILLLSAAHRKTFP